MPDHLEQHQSVRLAVEENSSTTSAYIVMNCLAAIVACYGLLENSAAVVIGAMIIAMLLGPITGVALGLVDGDNHLLVRAFLAEVIGVVVVLCVALVIGIVHRQVPIGSEILARTSPNLLDLMIALAGGAAGAYAAVSPRLSVGLVGVAIATALVPPLSCCSLLLARGEVRLAAGAFLLFLTNFVGIQFASSVVLWLHGFRGISKRSSSSSPLLRNAASVAILIVLGLFLGIHFKRTLAKQRFESAVRAQLSSGLEAVPGAYLAETRFTESDDVQIVFAVVRTPTPINPQLVAALERRIPRPDDVKVELRVRSIAITETNREGYIFGSHGQLDTR